MEKSRSIKFLEAHQAKEKSKFIENAFKRQNEQMWLNWSQCIALSIMDFMIENNVSRSDLADNLGVTHQYVSEILSGKANFSLKSIASISNKLHLNLTINSMLELKEQTIVLSDNEKEWISNRITTLKEEIRTSDVLMANEPETRYGGTQVQSNSTELDILTKISRLLY